MTDIGKGAPGYEDTNNDTSNYTGKSVQSTSNARNEDASREAYQKAIADVNRLQKKIKNALAMSDDEFFHSRKWFQQVSDEARGQGQALGRWAVLSEALAFFSARMPPTVRIEPMISDDWQPLNLFVANTGVSGLGKGQTFQLASDLIPTDGVGIDQAASGEAVPALFAKRVKKQANKKDSITIPKCIQACEIIRYDEAGWLGGASSRQGSTMIPTFESAFTGSMLGGATKKMDNSITVPAGCYRLCMVVDTQPDQAKVFLSHEGTGFPQRFIWTTPEEPGLTEKDCDWTDVGEHQKVRKLIDPSFQLPPNTGKIIKWLTEQYKKAEELPCDLINISSYEHNIWLPPAAKMLMKKQSIDRITGKHIEPAHRSELVSRVAALFAIMDKCGPDGPKSPQQLPEEIYITEDNWALAKRFMSHSDQVQDDFLSQARHEQIEKDRQWLAEKDAAKKAHYQHILIRHLEKKGPSDKDTLFKGVHTNLRPDYEQALEDILDKRIFCQTVGPQGRKIYYLKGQEDQIGKNYPEYAEPGIVVKREDIVAPLKPDPSMKIPDLNAMGYKCNYMPIDPQWNKAHGCSEKGCVFKITYKGKRYSWKEAAIKDLPTTRTRPTNSSAYAEIPGPCELVWDLDMPKDDPNGLSGWEWFQMHVGKYGSKEMPLSTVDKTPHGGYHYRVIIPAELAKHMKQLTHIDGINIDVKSCQQGYGLGPGSRITDGSYQMCDDHKPPMISSKGRQAQLLRWMLAMTERTNEMPVSTTPPRPYRVSSTGGKPTHPKYEHGNRNNGEFGHYIGRARHYPQDWEQQKRDLYEDAHAMGLGDKEIGDLTNSIYKEAKKDGAPLP